MGWRVTLLDVGHTPVRRKKLITGPGKDLAVLTMSVNGPAVSSEIIHRLFFWYLLDNDH